MQKLEPILTENPFFEGLDKGHIQLLAGCASEVQFNSGDFIFREGQDANVFYIILSGRVALEAVFRSEQESATIQNIGEGDVLGWSWLFPPYRWHFDARAVAPTQAIALDGKHLRAKCDEDHDFGYELLKRFAHVIEQRLQAMRSQIPDIYAIHS
jgi:CRP/FNR family cyclic AMP-dependent transcriptional regulator